MISSERYEQIKQIIANLFVLFNMTFVPFNPFELADKLGLSVKSYDEYPLSLTTLLSVSSDGFLTGRGAQRMILYNSHQPWSRVIFTIFHEIGHFVLGHRSSIGKYEIEEAEANFFAKYILTPPILVQTSGSKTADDVSMCFGTSNEASKYSLSYCNKWYKHVRNAGYSATDITIYKTVKEFSPIRALVGVVPGLPEDTKLMPLAQAKSYLDNLLPFDNIL